MIKKPVNNEDWIEAIKSSMTNNSKPYTTAKWMHIETGKPVYTIRHIFNKMILEGVLIKIKVNDKCVWYKINNNHIK